MKIIQKSFPADTSEVSVKRTFLNDNKIDGLMYAYFQSISMPCLVDGHYETRVDKASIPTQKIAAQKIRLSTAATWRKHLAILIDRGYLVDCGEYFLLPQIEEIFFTIPLDTLKFMVDTLQEDVIKVYIYLGQRAKYAKSQGRLYSFTKKELRNALGMSDSESNREFIQNALNCLINNGLIRIAEYSDGRTHRIRLVEVNSEYIENFFSKQELVEIVD